MSCWSKCHPTSLELQGAFGLRREEAIKFVPAYADQDNRRGLKASWTKGGKAREIPVLTPEQRSVLDRAHRLAGFADPGTEHVHTTASTVRTAHGHGGVVQIERIAACLYPIARPAIDGLGLSGFGRSCGEPSGTGSSGKAHRQL
ncbi:integrase domain-containing protein [Pseudomaricurvus hydrocarbonicus]|uniref:integrase domain-containing protein n=1 Tax=Pseudomaricurvus hydrocarbonicus TaxID=1470433 RepID=UPI003C7ADDFC